MPDSKSIARQIFRQTLASIDIPHVMESKLQIEGRRLVLPDKSIELSSISKVRVIAIGKAAHAMAVGLYDLLPANLHCRGIVSAPTSPALPLPGFVYFVSGHPTPDEQSWRAAVAILELLRECDDRTLIFFLLSGGGSALVELPLDRLLKMEEVQQLHRALVTCGAPIESINTVRKHLSAVKGGRLTVAAGSATKITLAVTDVPVGRESSLASGPSLPDPSTTADVQGIISRYDLRAKFPEPLLRWLDADQMPETPKTSHPAFANSHFVLLLGMHDLFHAAHHASEARGYMTRCDNSTDDWPIDKAVDALLSQLEDWQRENPGQRVALIADGEVASPVTGNGIGGRNSAFVLACVEKIAGRRITILSAGTDGIDGNSPGAGAVADGQSFARANALGIEPSSHFQQSDAYTFFEKLDDAIVTGPTNNNLRDLRILLSEPFGVARRHISYM
jgi:glycerate 2-kinase